MNGETVLIPYVKNVVMAEEVQHPALPFIDASPISFSFLSLTTFDQARTGMEYR